MKKVILFLSLFVCCYFSSQAQDPVQQEIMMRMLGLKTALLNKDSLALTGLLADDVSYGHSNGLLQSKAALIHDVMSGVQDYKSIEPSDMLIRVYNNSAVVTIKSKVKMIFQDKPMEIGMNVTLVWIQKESDWKLVARQSVKTD